MNRKDRAVLEYLSERDAYGSDLVKAGLLSRYSCYVRLARFEERGLIHGASVADGRRKYSITDEGIRAMSSPSPPAARVHAAWWKRLVWWLT